MTLALACAACSQEDAPAEEVVEAAEKIVDPAAQPAPLARGKWAPRDTCDTIEGAGEFRQRLAAAVRTRDTDALVAMAAEDVKLDFGGGTGTVELRRRLDDPSRRLWSELEELLPLGCSANRQGGITIPWYFDQDMGAIDPAATMLVTGQDVPIFAAPDPQSQRLGTISWDTVKLVAFEPAAPYQQVELPEQQIGFIATDALRSLLDYRLIASSRNGRWRITSFVAGD